MIPGLIMIAIFIAIHISSKPRVLPPLSVEESERQWQALQRSWDGVGEARESLDRMSEARRDADGYAAAIRGADSAHLARKNKGRVTS